MKNTIALILIALLFSGCGVRKTQNEKTHQHDQSESDLKVKVESETNTTTTEETKTEAKATDQSKVTEGETTDVTADEATVNSVTGDYHFKGNVKFNNQKTKQTRAVKKTETKQLATVKVDDAKKEKSDIKASEKKDNVLNTGKKTTEAKASFFSNWMFWVGLAIVAFAIIFFRKWLL